ncbi:RNA-guided endonuclease InsQ/TnpB family protein [Lentibacillus salicampi]|uniref:Transposase n=1 Tax=Lentibacillus salicampi TaxID=175306 RepID=A0A4Y9A6N2_9BACI|nr:RNA-guided endonuclease TnpB family protein [Lentibacillus salicampi]TFJ91336.1 transposase [Lentibacillus salicampi]
MEQTITVKIKLLPDTEQENYLANISRMYIETVNKLVSVMVETERVLKWTSKDVHVPMPSAVKNQAIRDAKSVYRRSKTIGKVPILKKPVCIWNNQNYRIRDDTIQIPVWLNGRAERISIKGILTDYQRQLLKHHRGTLRITKKSNKWIAQISVRMKRPKQKSTGIIMGVDLGLKVPAVAVTSNGKTKFFGKGRQNKFVRRKYAARRLVIGKSKKPVAYRKINDKEKRWMKEQDHKISRQIIDFAVDNHVSVIRMEKLKGIQKTARTSRKNEKNLHNWSFYRLCSFIEYKGNLAGIKVEYVDPKYTSQTCPQCHKRNKVRDRNYHCSCGFRSHRDRVAGMNIIHAPVMDGVV